MYFTSGPRWGDVYLVAAARGISYCGDFLAATALALTLQTAGDNGIGVAGLLLAAIVPMAVLGPVGGRLADRIDSRTLLVTVGLAQAAVCTVLAYTNQTAVMIALVAVLAAGLAIVQPTLGALVPEMVGPERLGKANAITQTGSSLGMLLGPALGGLLVGVAGARLPLLIDAGTYLALVAAGLLLRTRRGGRSVAPAADETPAPPWRMWDDRLLVALMVAFFAVIATVTAVNVADVFFVRETLGASTTTYGLLDAVWTAGVLFGAWPVARLAGRSDTGLVQLQLFALTALCGLVALSAGVPAVGWLVPIFVVGGCLNAALNVLSGVVVGRRVPAAVRGRAFGAFSAVASTANMSGYVAGGLLLQVLSPRGVILGTGLAGMAVGLVFFVPHLIRGWLAAPHPATPPTSRPAALGYRAET